MEIQIWQHATSGEWFAVMFDGATGRVADAAGPLHHSELEQVAAGFDGDADLAAAIDSDQDAYNWISLVCREDD